MVFFAGSLATIYHLSFPPWYMTCQNSTLLRNSFWYDFPSIQKLFKLDIRPRRPTRARCPTLGRLSLIGFECGGLRTSSLQPGRVLSYVNPSTASGFCTEHLPQVGVVAE
ncbi:hypothetical protein GWI33_021777 [Rhynchophorus ferrugineus]|uniref:Uncharacterized protein n=1 Tax=Rhynchophorus ferrugineus TaxID=354439 RepID=A0A834HPB0_RHYFE|nr:hypothetical protein GWI33_021777 [Rhynchophorus ferrugineus]